MHRIIILLCLSVVHAQLQVNGTCDLANIPTHMAVSEKLAGTWYQIARIPNSVEKGECAHTNVTIISENITSAVVAIHMDDSEVVNGKLVLRNATIVITSQPGVWNLTSNDGTPHPIVIMGTDYDEYAMMYSCQNNGNTSTINAWKFGRNTTYSEKATNATQLLAESANIANTTWKVVQHSESACKLNNGAINLHVPPVLLLLVALIGVAKEL